MIELISSIKSFGNGPPCAAAYGPPLGNAFNVSVCSDGCFFASNLYNSFDILPNYIVQLLAVLGSLDGGAAAGRSFVSIYESGSTDRTPALLRVLARLLHIMGVPNRIIAGGKLTRAAFARRGWWPLGGGGPVDRIRFLAAARNAVLEPLTDPRCGAQSTAAAAAAGAASPSHSHSLTDPAQTASTVPAGCASPGTSKVVFLNDVFFCAQDVLRLLQYPSAHIVCGLDLIKARMAGLTRPEREAAMRGVLIADWGISPAWAAWLSHVDPLFKLWKRLYWHSTAWWPWSYLVFYDIWVARDVSGRRLNNTVPYVHEPETGRRLAEGRPVPVYCCWNGVAVLDAEPLRTGAVRFRSHGPGECAASECSLLCDDLHVMGRHRVLLDPNVRVAYDWDSVLELYDNLDAVVPRGVRGLPYRRLERGDVQEVEAGWGAWEGRAAAAAQTYECCGISPDTQTVDYDHGCRVVDLTAGRAAAGA